MIIIEILLLVFKYYRGTFYDYKLQIIHNQVLALCGVRKLLEYIFTTHEIKWLDDIIPEDKKKENDKKKKKQHGEGADGKKVCLFVAFN